jgi:hypothetical protein
VPADPSRLLAGLCFMTTLPRAEVREALRARSLVLEAMVSGTASSVRGIEQNRTAPASTVELFHVTEHWLEGERAWVRDVCGRIDAGRYRFLGEPGYGVGPVDGRWPPAVDDPASGKGA